MKNIGELISNMVTYYAGDVKRINHFLKVYGFAKAIGEKEGLVDSKQEILEVAAIIHDIGIKVSEQKYNSSSGKYQQIEGPAIAEKMLRELGYAEELIDRVHFLVAHHHTYDNIDDVDYQILIESDLLVNIAEEQLSFKTINNIRDKIFRTKTGKIFLRDIYSSLDISIENSKIDDAIYNLVEYK